MKYFLIAFIILSIITPAFAELDQDDLNKIRLIIKEEIDPIKTDVAKMQSKLEGIEKRITDTKNLTYALIALVIAAIGIPQIIIAWRSKKTSEQDKKLEVLTSNIETLTAEIETLKSQHIPTP